MACRGRTFAGRIAPVCGWRTYAIAASVGASSDKGFRRNLDSIGLGA
jgi:hypothetical protein